MKSRFLSKLLVLVLVLLTVTLIAEPAYAVTYEYSVSGASQCTVMVGDTLKLSNPQSASEMDLYDYSWSFDGPKDCIELTDNGRKATVVAKKAGTVKICAELYGSIPVTNTGIRYNSATGKYESYTYTTYVSRQYKSYLVATIYDDNPPSIPSLPDEVIVANGKIGSFALNATTGTGTSLKYQWYIKNAGKSRFSKSSVTKSSYSFTMTEKSDGRQVYCVVTDGNGKSTKSETVTLKMAAPVAVKTQPKTVSVAAGSTAKTSVKASGQGTLKYQWYIKNPGKSSYSKSSVTTRTYSVRMTPSVNGRKAYCVISDAYGQKIKTNTVTLKMSDTLSIYSQPTDSIAIVGDTVSTTVKASGSGTLKYQWYIKNPGKSSFSKSSVTKATYSATMSSKVNGRQVYCVITDASGAKITSKTVTLTGIPKLKITSQPTDAMVASGNVIKASVRTSGGSGVKYQWYVKNPGKSSFGKSSITKATYSATMKESMDGRQIYCVITDAYGQKETTNTVTLRMAAPITITRQPVNIWQVPGNTVTFRVQATGKGTLNYQWYAKDSGESSFSKVSCTSANYSFAMAEELDGRRVYCEITDSYGQTATSNTVKLTNAPPIVITTPLEDTSYAEPFLIQFHNDGITRTVKWYIAQPGGAFWYACSSSGTGGGKLTIRNNGSIANDEAYINGQIYCVISDSSGQSVKSNVAKILP